jgi:hypothetical protein
LRFNSLSLHVCRTMVPCCKLEDEDVAMDRTVVRELSWQLVAVHYCIVVTHGTLVSSQKNRVDLV